MSTTPTFLSLLGSHESHSYVKKVSGFSIRNNKRQLYRNTLGNENPDGNKKDNQSIKPYSFISFITACFAFFH